MEVHFVAVAVGGALECADFVVDAFQRTGGDAFVNHRGDPTGPTELSLIPASDGMCRACLGRDNAVELIVGALCA